MALTWICATVMIAIVAAAGGYLFGKRQRREPAGDSELNESLQRILLSDKHRLEALAHSLYHLTSKVDVQVGEHTARVGQITDSLDCNSDCESTVSAAQLLISTNLKLKSELDAAKDQIQKQREQMASCMLESRTDALTNVPNRRAFDLEINRVLSEWRQRSKAFTLLFLDIDHFKSVNDNYGHMVGDQVLKSVANCLKNNVRGVDFLARFGGEEFAVILPDTKMNDAILIAERLRMEVERWTHRGGQHEISITTSIGIKEIHDLDCESDLLLKTDTALYAAKKCGRNCCYAWNNASSISDRATIQISNTETVELARAELPLSQVAPSDQMSTCA